MELWMRVGAKCVCVRDAATVSGYAPLVYGAVYTIREIFNDPHWPDSSPHFRLVEVRGKIFDTCLFRRFESGWRHDRFRPLVRQTDIASLRALLDQPADPALVREALDDVTLDVVQRIGMRTS